MSGEDVPAFDVYLLGFYSKSCTVHGYLTRKTFKVNRTILIQGHTKILDLLTLHIDVCDNSRLYIFVLSAFVSPYIILPPD